MLLTLVSHATQLRASHCASVKFKGTPSSVSRCIYRVVR